MNGTPYPVTLQIPQVQGLCNYTFTRESCISMYQNWQGTIYIQPGASSMIVRFLRGTCHALNNRVNKLQVTWIGRKSDLEIYSSSFFKDSFSAQVILHITDVPKAKTVGERNSLLIFHMSKFAEYSSIRFLKHMREYIQPATMRHTYYYFTGTAIDCSLDNLIQHRHQHIRPFK